MQFNQVNGSPVVRSAIQAQPGEIVLVLRHALGNLIELLSDPSSADRAHNATEADRQILVAQQLLNDINANSDAGTGTTNLESVLSGKMGNNGTMSTKDLLLPHQLDVINRLMRKPVSPLVTICSSSEQLDKTMSDALEEKRQNSQRPSVVIRPRSC